MIVKSILLLFISLAMTTVFAQKKPNPRKSLDPNLYPFYHGVASGDPLEDRIILWTRVSEESLVDSVLVEWRIGTDTMLSNIVTSGQGYAYEANDWTFKIDVTGLSSDMWYYYDFKSLDRHSLVGRTKTAPSSTVDQVRIGVVSCSNYEVGYFEAYKYLMERNDVDAILHLGDYIYEYGTSGNSIGREEVVPSNEIITLEDYRLRYSHYKLDDDLRRLHQQYPFITVWDDHESANNSWLGGAENHTEGAEGSWEDRKYNSGKAYHEWLPIRSPDVNSHSIYRKFQYGNLIDLYMLDTRIEGRSLQGGDTDDTTRTLLGQQQFEWLTTNLGQSNATWKILGQQVMMAPLEFFGVVLNDDQWDGYNFERQRLYNYLLDNTIDNFVVLTGDIHTSWVSDLPLSNYVEANCIGSVGVEYVVTSVTSSGLEVIGGIGGGTITALNPHIQYTNLSDKGYMVLDVRPNKVIANYYYMNDISSSGNGEFFEVAYACNVGEKCTELTTQSSNNGQAVPFAPFAPLDQLSLQTNESPLYIGTFPNPFESEFILQMYLNTFQELSIEIQDNTGKICLKKELSNLQLGPNYVRVNMEGFKPGVYQLMLLGKEARIFKKLLKQ